MFTTVLLIWTAVRVGVVSAGNDGSFNVYLGSFDRVTRIAQLDYSMGKGYEFLASLLPEVTGRWKIFSQGDGTGWRLLDTIRSSFNDVVVSKTQELLEDFCSLDFFFFLRDLIYEHRHRSLVYLEYHLHIQQCHLGQGGSPGYLLSQV